MKIALCLSGYFNSLTDSTSKGVDGFEHIRKHILSKGDIDVFIHTWDIDNMGIIKGLYEPYMKIMKIQHQKDFSNIINTRGLNDLAKVPRSPQIVLSHLYGVSESIKLAYEGGITYDIVIKGRFDLGRINRNTSGPNKHNPYPVQCINLLDKIESDKLYMADWNHFHMGPADMWYYGDYKTMKLFTNLYDSLENEMFIDSEFHKFATKIENNRGDLSNAVAFYKYWMIQNGLWDKKEVLPTTWE
jgi:hypothetical protein